MQLKVNSAWVQNIPLLKVIPFPRYIFFGYFFIPNLLIYFLLPFARSFLDYLNFL